MSTVGKIIATVAFFLLLMVLGYAIANSGNEAEYERMRATADELRAGNEQLAAENARLERLILSLREDPRIIERQARNDLDLVRRDEILVVIDGAER